MPQLVDISWETCHEHLNRIVDIENLSFPTPWSRKSFLEEIRNPISRFWGVLAEQVLQGYICFWVFAEENQLINIAIHPQKREQGLGHYLLTKMIEESISMGVRKIWLEVRPSNHRAKSLYTKFKFSEEGRRPRYYRDTNEDAIVMSLSLMNKENRLSLSNC
jgi:ribosomal-protein-alanine N-acetyltransferase